jgi:hypothetical protein
MGCFGEGGRVVRWAWTIRERFKDEWSPGVEHEK